MGNRELLTIKLALEEWRHWLGVLKSHFLFQPITNAYKNSELQKDLTWDKQDGRHSSQGLTSRYPTDLVLRTAKLTHYLEWKPKRNMEKDKTILSPTCWINAISWDFDTELENTLPYHTSEECPTDKKYVPPRLRNKLISWVHTSPASGYPGTLKTCELLKERYWWPLMSRKVNEVVSSCSTCTQAKVPRHLPVGKLMPLQNPQRPWSHISLDSLTDLPESENNTVQSSLSS